MYMQKLFGVIASNVSVYQYILKSTFFSFLTAQGASAKTQKNYWSDVADFISWFIAATPPVIDAGPATPGLLLQAISPNHINDYVSHLLRAKISPATVNRRLSSLRIFFNCCLEMTWLPYHPMKGIANIKTANPSGPKLNTSLLTQFEDHLRSHGVGKATIKNYLSDVRQFLRWIEVSGRQQWPTAYGRQ